MTNWALVRHFQPGEFGGLDAANRMSPALIATLDRLRDCLGVPIVIHLDGLLSTRKATPDSQHPLGNAVDCHAYGTALLDFWLAAEAISTFTGIGLYPYWQIPGLHLDVRPTSKRVRWWQRGDKGYDIVTRGTLAFIGAKLG